MWRAGCISQDTYLLYDNNNNELETRSIPFVYDINNISETGLTTLAGDDGVRNIALVAKDESAEKIQRELSTAGRATDRLRTFNWHLIADHVTRESISIIKSCDSRQNEYLSLLKDGRVKCETASGSLGTKTSAQSVLV